MSSVQILVGNDYRKIPASRAPLDRSGRFKKIHEVTIFVDVVSGHPDVIERVIFDLGASFSPKEFVCHYPTKIVRPNGTAVVHRFATKQTVFGGFQATMRIRGAGGTNMNITHSIILNESANRIKPASMTFTEQRGIQPLRPVKLPEGQKFGVELELTTANNVTTDYIAQCIPMECHVVGSWSEGQQTRSAWKIVPDSSVQCNITQPDCNTFELVSPVLSGGSGLSALSKVLGALPSNGAVKVNKSMAVHVHVDVSGLSLAQLIKVCQNFCKYEQAMDSFMPPSRRNNPYALSNRESVGGHTNRQIHTMLQNCADLASLVRFMNRQGRYYKLNLQNLVTGRQPTIEFRQHSASFNYSKISSWIRFCVWFVHSSAKLQAPKCFAENRTHEYMVEALFNYVIKDRVLYKFYNDRRQQLLSGNSHDEDYCCGECEAGGSCQATNSNITYSSGYMEIQNSK